MPTMPENRKEKRRRINRTTPMANSRAVKTRVCNPDQILNSTSLHVAMIPSQINHNLFEQVKVMRSRVKVRYHLVHFCCVFG